LYLPDKREDGGNIGQTKRNNLLVYDSKELPKVGYLLALLDYYYISNCIYYYAVIIVVAIGSHLAVLAIVCDLY
jgi:hypothetical protein